MIRSIPSFMPAPVSPTPVPNPLQLTPSTGDNTTRKKPTMATGPLNPIPNDKRVRLQGFNGPSVKTPLMDAVPSAPFGPVISEVKPNFTLHPTDPSDLANAIRPKPMTVTPTAPSAADQQKPRIMLNV